MSNQKFKYEVQRDVWTSEGERIRKGTIAELTAEEAQDGIEAGSLKRIKEPSTKPKAD